VPASGTGESPATRDNAKHQLARLRTTGWLASRSREGDPPVFALRATTGTRLRKALPAEALAKAGGGAGGIRTLDTALDRITV
jgi:hypothetical protein